MSEYRKSFWISVVLIGVILPGVYVDVGIKLKIFSEEFLKSIPNKFEILYLILCIFSAKLFALFGLIAALWLVVTRFRVPSDDETRSLLGLVGPIAIFSSTIYAIELLIPPRYPQFVVAILVLLNLMVIAFNTVGTVRHFRNA